jgi:hypothetical protein
MNPLPPLREGDCRACRDDYGTTVAGPAGAYCYRCRGCVSRADCQAHPSLVPARQRKGGPCHDPRYHPGGART